VSINSSTIFCTRYAATIRYKYKKYSNIYEAYLWEEFISRVSERRTCIKGRSTTNTSKYIFHWSCEAIKVQEALLIMTNLLLCLYRDFSFFGYAELEMQDAKDIELFP